MENMKKPMSLAEFSRKGGEAGRGAKKVRGDADYYRQLALKRAAKRAEREAK
jgi:hypothetical protein